YKKITDELVHSDIHDLISPINFSLEEVQTNYVEHAEKNQEYEDELILDDSVPPQEPSDVFPNQSKEQINLDNKKSNEQIESQDNQQAVSFRENTRKDQ
ncbi:20223_t:CDS:2, partial [Gigaspora margarita]